MCGREGERSACVQEGGGDVYMCEEEKYAHFTIAGSILIPKHGCLYIPQQGSYCISCLIGGDTFHLQ